MYSTPTSILIAGANGGIGQALLTRFHEDYPQATILTLSRHAMEPLSLRHQHLSIDLTQQDATKTLVDYCKAAQITPDWVVQCCGTLHDADHLPEKSLSQMDAGWLHQLLDINVLTHVAVGQAMDQLLPRKHPLLWASISAQIGSIEDNRLGGWYSYRMTKAALNMWVKTLAVEWQRKRPNSCVIALHPGTTDTPLTRPFQGNIPESQLSSSEKTAHNLQAVLVNRSNEDTGSFYNHLGQQLPW